MTEQMTFVISRKGDRWWGHTFGAPNWSVFSNNRAEVERACREFVAERTGRPSSETTILFVDEPPSSPQRDALCAIDDRLSSLEYEVGGLRVVVNEALLLEARSDSDRAVERVRAVCDRIWDDARYAHKYGFLEVVREVRYALEGDSNE